MNAAELAAAATAHFGAHGFAALAQTAGGPDLLLGRGQERMALALLPEQPDERAYRNAFEAGLQRLLAARRQQPAWQLGLALAIGSTAAGAAASYRRSLKKYSNAIIFEDVQIGLLLAGAGAPLWLAAGEVNTFLRGLNRWVAARLAPPSAPETPA